MTPSAAVPTAGALALPTISFGTFQIPPGDTERTVSTALEIGYRSIDTAASYGNEAAVGRAIGSSGVARNELFVTGKVWAQDAGARATRDAFLRTQDALALDRLDLYLIHQPVGDYYGSWRTLQQLRDDDVVGAIGVSNFSADRLLDLALFSGTPPSVNQLEIHPLSQRRQERIIGEDHGVVSQAWSPFAQGQHGLLENRILSEIAAHYEVTVPQLILRWLIQENIAVVTKSTNPIRMRQNLAVPDFAIDGSNLKRIAALDTGNPLLLDHRDPAIIGWLAEARIH